MQELQPALPRRRMRLPIVDGAAALLGDEPSHNAPAKKKTPKTHRHDCIENISAISGLLKKMGPHDKLLQQMEACVQVLRAKAQKK